VGEPFLILYNSRGFTRPARRVPLGRREPRSPRRAAKVSADERADYKTDFKDRSGITIAWKGFFMKPILPFITCRICVLGLYLRNLCFTSLRE